MTLLQRLPVFFALAALVVAASATARGNAVLCFGVGDGHVAVEAAGPGHCGGEAAGKSESEVWSGARSGVHGETGHVEPCGVARGGGCIDLAWTGVDLDRPERPASAEPTVPVAVGPALALMADPAGFGASAHLRAALARPPPPSPHLAALSSLRLRL